MYEQRRADVAVFIDFENVYVSVRDKLNANPNFEAIMDRCSDLGRVVISRAYADWYRYPRVTSALYANAIEPIYVATYYYDKDMGRTGRAIKNSVDMNLCIDAMKTLFTNTNISRFVLVTGDRDFIPLVNSIRQQGKEVYIIGIGGAASTHLAQSADEFVFYEQLVGRQPAATAAATAIANRATELNRGIDLPPPEPSQRERDRDRERERDRDREREREVIPEPVAATPPPAPAVSPTAPSESDIYEVLVEAIHLVRKRGYVSTLGSIKLVMKELMGGDFKESRYRDLNGRPFAKFKDFVMDAEKRGKVQIFTNGTVNEVFLPGEDPHKLSQFAAALSEEAPVEPVLDKAVLSNGRAQITRPERPTPAQSESGSGAAAPAGRRRRRRSRRGQGNGADASAELVGAEAELDDPDYTSPFEETGEPDDELQELDALEQPAALADLFEDELPEAIIAAEFDALPFADELVIEDTLVTPVSEATTSFDTALSADELVIEDTLVTPVSELVAGFGAALPLDELVVEDTPLDAVVEAELPAEPAEQFADELATGEVGVAAEPVESFEDTSQAETARVFETDLYPAESEAPAETPLEVMVAIEEAEQSWIAEVVAAVDAAPTAEAPPSDDTASQTAEDAEQAPATGEAEATYVAQAAEAAEQAPATGEAADAELGGDAAQATPTAEPGEPLVDTTPVAPEELAVTAVTAEAGEPEGDEANDEAGTIEPIEFNEGEWTIFREMMSRFTKAASFQQIFDTLRGMRKERGLVRTNEQLRTMVKQAINNGILERTGRGKRIYYTLKAEE